MYNFDSNEPRFHFLKGLSYWSYYSILSCDINMTSDVFVKS